ncbi:hypothetical protein DFJ74DRAFT_775001 [Hyaloraphidium curvatum]|nr:hypothetical protein DFJ74DRAFT_775001 [Hyaloraphidium curvatum]
MRFFPVGAAAVCLFVWEAVAAVVVHGAAEADEVSLSRRAGGGGWIPGPECCLACAYSAGCCCPPRPRPVTVNITVCRPPGRIVGRDDGELGEPDIAWDGPDDRAAEEERGWERRNCPVCPLGARVGRTGGRNAMHCCLARTRRVSARARPLRRGVRLQRRLRRLGRSWQRLSGSLQGGRRRLRGAIPVRLAAGLGLARERAQQSRKVGQARPNPARGPALRGLGREQA